jgi:hypothetical protein
MSRRTRLATCPPGDGCRTGRTATAESGVPPGGSKAEPTTGEHPGPNVTAGSPTPTRTTLRSGSPDGRSWVGDDDTSVCGNGGLLCWFAKAWGVPRVHETTRGDPVRLRAFTAAMSTRMARSEAVLADYRDALARLHAAPADLPIGVPDRSADLADVLAELRAVDQQPTRFAEALETADHVAWPTSVRGPAAGPYPAGVPSPPTAGWQPVRDQLAGFFLGDVFAWWRGDTRYLPGSVLAGANRVRRVVREYLLRYGQHVRSPLKHPAPVVPTSANGTIGRLLRLNRSPAVQTAFRRAGVVGGAVGTVTGTVELIRQGDPVEAYRQSGAAYVADVAGTAFSATSAAFFLAPSPWTAGAAVVTGAVWVGATVWDRREELREGFRTTTRQVGASLSSAAGRLSDAGSSVAGRVSGAAASVGGVLDRGRSLVGRFAPGVG